MYLVNRLIKQTDGAVSESLVIQKRDESALTDRIFALGADGFETVKFLDTMQDSPEDRGLLTWLTSTVSLPYLLQITSAHISRSWPPSLQSFICCDTRPPPSYSTSSPVLDPPYPHLFWRKKSPTKARTAFGRDTVPWFSSVTRTLPIEQ
jgi:hypothetical protein